VDTDQSDNLVDDSNYNEDDAKDDSEDRQHNGRFSTGSSGLRFSG